MWDGDVVLRPRIALDENLRHLLRFWKLKQPEKSNVPQISSLHSALHYLLVFCSSMLDFRVLVDKQSRLQCVDDTKKTVMEHIDNQSSVDDIRKTQRV